MIRTAITLCFLYSSFTGTAQAGIDHFLATAVSDVEYFEVLETEAYLSDHKFSSPWLREMDFRFRYSDPQIGIEEYRMRFGLINPFEIRANKRYREMIRGQMDFKKSASLNAVFLRRYELLIEHYFLSGRVSRIEEDLETLQSLQKLSMESTLSLKDLIDIEESLTKLTMEREELSQQLQVIDMIIGRRTKQSISWENVTLISADKVIETLGTRLLGDSSVNGLLAWQKLKEAESILKIKKAEAFSNIGFIQAEYELDRGTLPAEHLGFQVGVNIPIFNTDKPDLERRELSLIEDRAEVKVVSEFEKEQYELNMIEITSIIRQLRFIEGRLEQLARLKAVSRQATPDVNAVLKLQSLETYLHEHQVTLTADMLLRYILMLHQAGRLADQPYINYLAADLHNYDLRLSE